MRDEADIVAALEAVLRPLGTSLRHYMPVSKSGAIGAMRAVLANEADRCANVADDMRETHVADAIRKGAL